MRKYLAVMLITGIVSCTNTDKKVAGNPDTTSNVKVSNSDVELKDSNVQTIFNGYITLKDALVSSKVEDIKKTAQVLSIDLANYKGCENTARIADEIAIAKDIKAQRKAFTFLSADLIAMFKHADIKKGSIFVQHCPMANNGDGGDWLATEKKIQNPYYGDEMLTCGAVLEEIKEGK